MPSELMKEMASWAFWLGLGLGFWCTFRPKHFVAFITLHRANVPRYLVPVFRLAGILALIGGLWRLIEYIRNSL